MADNQNFFTLIKKDDASQARRGSINLGACQAPTPLFMPVGTQATVKGMTPEELERIGFTIILANTYHLYLRPGLEVIGKMGGLHKFMGWNRGILTDSGGFQVFSLRERSSISEEGVVFRSHIDGSKHTFTAENVVAMQFVFGSDIIMPLDECVPSDSSWDYVKESLGRTHRWAERSIRAFNEERERHEGASHHLFGIVQGGVYDNLRRESAEFIGSQPFSGCAIGGLSVGESKEAMHHVLEEIAPLLPEDKPRYLMGVGGPDDLFMCVERGVDIFDCVLPTRMGRTGTILTSQGKMVIKNARYKFDSLPPDEECHCYTCSNFTRSYLRHLFMAEEMLGPWLATYHNLYFLNSLVEAMRTAIEEKRFVKYREEFISRYNQGIDA
ncbi:MAG: tRNA guanosine(34) transglycosylase Tgt [Vulcanimicrobiota bacterium]